MHAGWRDTCMTLNRIDRAIRKSLLPADSVGKHISIQAVDTHYVDTRYEDCRQKPHIESFASTRYEDYRHNPHIQCFFALYTLAWCPGSLRKATPWTHRHTALLARSEEQRLAVQVLNQTIRAGRTSAGGPTHISASHALDVQKNAPSPS